MEAVRWYCSDCGALLAPESTEGCCVNIDRRTGTPARAGVLPPLQWEELEEEEQALVVALSTFGAAPAEEEALLERLDWTSDLLHELVAPAGGHAAEIACCIHVHAGFRLTEQARDAFYTHLHALGAQIEGSHRHAA